MTQLTLPEAISTTTTRFLQVNTTTIPAAARNVIKDLAAKLDNLSNIVTGFAQKFTTHELCVDNIRMVQQSQDGQPTSTGQGSGAPPTPSISAPAENDGTSPDPAAAGNEPVVESDTTDQTQTPPAEQDASLRRRRLRPNPKLQAWASRTDASVLNQRQTTPHFPRGRLQGSPKSLASAGDPRYPIPVTSTSSF